MKLKTIIVLFCMVGFFIPIHPITQRLTTKSSTLFGSVYVNKGVQELAGLRVFYKGGEYSITVAPDADTKKADFELYDDEKPTYVHMVISDDFKKPAENTVAHWQTLPEHPYRYYRLTRYSLIETVAEDTNFNTIKKGLFDHKDSWEIEELDNTKSTLVIPDNAIIVFMPADIVERLEPISWLSNNTSVKLPVIVLKETLTVPMLRDILARVSATLPDFRAWHKEPFKAYVPYTSNHILSMPFTPRGYTC